MSNALFPIKLLWRDRYNPHKHSSLDSYRKHHKTPRGKVFARLARIEWGKMGRELEDLLREYERIDKEAN